jgi:LacI family transcriptional regulator
MATLEEVAAAAGVSRNTVSRVLNGKTKAVWPSIAERAERIRRAAAKLGYRPHGAARAMSRGRFGCAALLLSTEPGRSTLPKALLDGVHDALVRHDMHLTVARLPDEKLTSEGFVPKVLREWTADGLLINYNRDIPQKMVGLIERHSLPAIWLNCKRKSDCVHPDDLGAGRMATEHLIALGHRMIAYVHYSPADEEPRHYSEVDRQAGYEKAMRSAGLAPRVLRPAPREGELDLLGFTRPWLSGRDRPTAVVAYGHPSLVQYAAATMGLRVPDDLSVVCFAERRPDALGSRVTTAIVPAFEMGSEGVEMLIQKLKRPKKALAPRVVPARIGEGATTAPPPKVRS